MKEITNVADIQSVLYETLCYLDDFCKENGIKYYLANGTLLGAAKYKGFIPWDDDIDVILLREDYDKLTSLSTINNEKYKLFCHEQVPTWHMPYAKLSCEKTVLKEGEYDFGADIGLSVDVFPIDNWSSFLPLAKLQALRSEILKRLLICSIGKDFETKKKGIKKLILKSIWYTAQKMGQQKVLSKINKNVERSRTRKKKYSGPISWTCHYTKEVILSDFFEKTVQLTFEDRTFPVFPKYEEYLDRLYPAWRSELPPEKQISNHNIKVWYKDEN